MADLAQFGGRNVADLAKIMGLDVPAGGALAEDVEGDTKDATTTNAGGSYFRRQVELANGVEAVLVTKTQNYDASSLAFAAAFTNVVAGPAGWVLRLYMAGVLMQTSANLTGHSLNYVLRDFRAMSGAQACELRIYNGTGGSQPYLRFGYTSASQAPGAIAIGSVKLV